MVVKRTALVICESLLPEVESVLPDDVELRVQELGLHDYPEKLHQALVENLADLEKNHKYDRIILGYGLCAYGVLGLRTTHAQLVLPRTDDCIGLFLGSRAAYLSEHTKEPGTYYFTKGWIKPNYGPLAMYLGKHTWTRKYCPEKAHWLAKEVMKNYTRVAVIDTGIYDIAPYVNYARETAEIFGFKYEVLPGTIKWIRDLVNGPWDERFITVEPGVTVTREMFD